MPFLWLSVSVGLYAVGLLYALVLLTRRAEGLSRIILPAVSLGMVFHFVSLVEYAVREDFRLATVHHSESLLAFFLMVMFLVVRIKYKTPTTGVFIFPVVFLLTFASVLAQRAPELSSPVLRSGWIFGHIALIFTGYAALFVSFGASLLYIVQEKNLKSKLKGRSAGDFSSRLPALEIIDEIGYKSLLLGFPFMTLGLVMGAVVAQARFGPTYYTDPKVMLSLIMWTVYILLLYTRWNNGWRGRRAAYLGAVAFVVALGAWAANYFSRVHDLERFMRS